MRLFCLVTSEAFRISLRKFLRLKPRFVKYVINSLVRRWNISKGKAVWYGLFGVFWVGWAAEKVLVFVSGFDVQVIGNVVVCVEWYGYVRKMNGGGWNFMVEFGNGMCGVENRDEIDKFVRCVCPNQIKHCRCNAPIQEVCILSCLSKGPKSTKLMKPCEINHIHSHKDIFIGWVIKFLKFSRIYRDLAFITISDFSSYKWFFQ